MSNDNVLEIIVKQNPYLTQKFDHRVMGDVGKYKSGDVLACSKYIGYIKHHFLIGDKANCNILPDVIKITTYKPKANLTDPDEILSTEIVDRTAPRVRKVSSKPKKTKVSAPAVNVNTGNPPVVSSNPWAAMLGTAFGNDSTSETDEVVKPAESEQSETDIEQ